MKGNSKENLEIALDELCSCQTHLNTAYLHAENDHNRNEIHTALKSIDSAIDSAQNTLNKFKD
ncbi:hypothetical protein GNF79_18715 [Clostridium perfringens]|jgi:hypothetical protein|uniref:DUF1657 domain-containing protein n=2 Tax=Clostridium perfringens TaxID=1502 RepID=A0AAW9ID04_CLOPF|nr:hypothetical protein [Clostridium perfringens]MDZ5001054.1 hypothetical protein [Clostridium perfringens]